MAKRQTLFTSARGVDSSLPGSAGKARGQLPAWKNLGLHLAAVACLLLLFFVVLSGLARPLLGLKIFP